MLLVQSLLKSLTMGISPDGPLKLKTLMELFISGSCIAIQCQAVNELHIALDFCRRSWHNFRLRKEEG